MKKKLLIILLVVLVVGIGLFVFRNFTNKPDNTEKEVSNLANKLKGLYYVHNKRSNKFYLSI